MKVFHFERVSHEKSEKAQIDLKEAATHISQRRVKGLRGSACMRKKKSMETYRKARG